VVGCDGSWEAEGFTGHLCGVFRPGNEDCAVALLETFEAWNPRDLLPVCLDNAFHLLQGTGVACGVCAVILEVMRLFRVSSIGASALHVARYGLPLCVARRVIRALLRYGANPTKDIRAIVPDAMAPWSVKVHRVYFPRWFDGPVHNVLLAWTLAGGSDLLPYELLLLIIGNLSRQR